MRFPPELKRGDTVLLVSPSSPLTEDQPIEKIAEAYGEHDFDFWFVEQAIDNAADSLKGGGENGALHTGTA